MKKIKIRNSPWGEIVGNNSSVSQSPTLDIIDKVKHYIKIKAHNTITLKF